MECRPASICFIFGSTGGNFEATAGADTGVGTIVTAPGVGSSGVFTEAEFVPIVTFVVFEAATGGFGGAGVFDTGSFLRGSRPDITGFVSAFWRGAWILAVGFDCGEAVDSVVAAWDFCFSLKGGDSGPA